MYIDTHTHLNFKDFNNDRDEVIKKSIEDGVERMIVVGARLDSSTSAVELASKYPDLYASVGFHPHHADELGVEPLKQLEVLAKNPKVVAIGEIGLDYHQYISETKPGISDKDLQKQIFLQQINLSQKLDLPVIIHCRDSVEDLLPLVAQLKSEFPRLCGVFHCFSENLVSAKQIVDLGLYLSFTPIITYPKNGYLRDIIRYIPLESIMLETDCPFLPPQSMRGLRSTPTAVKIVAQTIAEIKQLPLEQVENATTKNALSLFHL